MTNEPLDQATLEAVATEWMDIASAPKDGTRILLWLEPTSIAMPFEWRQSSAGDGRWMGDDYPLNMATATYWHPMPAPPKLPEQPA